MYQAATHAAAPHIPNGHAHHLANGHAHPPQPQQIPASVHQPPPPPQRQPPPASTAKEPIRVVGIPSISVAGGIALYGDSSSSSERSYTPIKVVGDGSFGTVWLVDWHSTLPPNTPLSPMQCGAGARPEWAGKRLVALKRMKKRWEGGWDECRKLKELESLRAIAFHENIIPLYDFFLLPSTKELYFVFESMEGNLYQLIKSRKGRPLAGGLVSSIFRQVVSGLHHIHTSGYFHRDMKPENLLVTTTGLFDYYNVSPFAAPNAPPERDVVVIVKLADFGLARETKSKPPYTEYVSTRWYRAPEVLLRSRDYSNPVDMWALGTIMAELINLKPLFPGAGEIDQVARICEILGDPSDEYGVDARGIWNGGGKWVKGVKMARSVGFTFPKVKPTPITSLFDKSIPPSMIECISDLLKYDPDLRLTSWQCLQHRYLAETTPRNMPPPPPPPTLHINTNGVHAPTAHLPTPRTTSLPSVSPRSVPDSHSHSPAYIKPIFNGTAGPHSVPIIPDVSASHRTSFYHSHSNTVSTHGSQSSSLNVMIPSEIGYRSSQDSQGLRQTMISPVPSSVLSGGGDRIVADGWPSATSSDSQTDWDMASPQAEVPPSSAGQPMDVQSSPMAAEDPSKPPTIQYIAPEISASNLPATQSGSKIRLGLGAFGKKRSGWGLGGMFGHGDKAAQNTLAPVDELNVASSSSTPSLKRTQSGSTDSRSLPEFSPTTDILSSLQAQQTQQQPAYKAQLMDAKMRKKEAERVALEAEKARRIGQEKRIRDQARAVMQKRNQIAKQHLGADLEWEAPQVGMRHLNVPKGKAVQRQGTSPIASSSSTVNAAGGRFRSPSEMPSNPGQEGGWREQEHRSKARRRDLDDDHSMSSSDVASISRMSVMSFATVDSDPGPGRLRHRPSVFGIQRMQSTSSLRTSFGDDFSPSARSSNSLSFEQQLVNDFDSRASFSSFDAAQTARSSLSEASSHSTPALHLLSLSPPPVGGRRNHPYPISLPPPIHAYSQQQLQQSGPGSPYEYGQHGHIQGQPPSPAIAPHSAINPMFKVPLTSSDQTPAATPHSLPPFAELASVAEQYPPLSPMSFNSPVDES